MNDIQLEHLGMFVKVKTFLSNKSSELTPTPIVGSSLQDTLIRYLAKMKQPRATLAVTPSLSASCAKRLKTRATK